ncbi:MAG: HAD hydrolase family protein, partial [Candidatus Micrarchaeaceae archaeon]
TKKVVFVDLDGTLCTEEKTFERSLATPLPGAREALQRMRSDGHTIVIWTARGWEQYRISKDWLDSHDFPYDQIIMGKPIASVFIDDRAQHFDGWERDYLEN